jgi:SSS family solute:Na+ symporter
MIRQVITSPVALGLFAAVIFGSILSSFNSALNSASTLFCLEFYERRLSDTQGEPQSEAEAQDRAKHVVKVGQYFGLSLALLAVLIAPQLKHMGTIFEYLQKANGLFSVPVISIFLVGILTQRASARGAKMAIVFGILTYSVFIFWKSIFGTEPIMH